jgi:hypothetical protein
MSTKPKAWAVGDPCPACSGELKPVPAPTDAQRTAAANRDNPVPLPPTVDSAEDAQIRELGALHRCTCGYQSRVAAADDASADDGADETADAKPAPARRTAKAAPARAGESA